MAGLGAILGPLAKPDQVEHHDRLTRRHRGEECLETGGRRVDGSHGLPASQAMPYTLASNLAR